RHLHHQDVAAELLGVEGLDLVPGHALDLDGLPIAHLWPLFASTSALAISARMTALSGSTLSASLRFMSAALASPDARAALPSLKKRLALALVTSASASRRGARSSATLQRSLPCSRSRPYCSRFCASRRTR